jgi:hypothetical protein
MNRKEFAKLLKEKPSGYSLVIKYRHEDFKKKICSIDPNRSFQENLYLWFYKKKPSLCKICDNPCSFKQFSHGYYEYCSCSCRAKDKKSFKNGTTKNAIDKRAKWRENLSEEEKIEHNLKITRARLKTERALSSEFVKERRLKYLKLHHPEETYKKLSSYDFLYREHCELMKPVTQIAKEMNLTWGVVRKSLEREGIKVINMGSYSSEENEIKTFIESLGFSVVQGSRRIIRPKEIDLYVPSKNVAIEYCGHYWHKEKTVGKNYHIEKTLACQDKGIKLLTIYDLEWKEKKDIVKSRIMHSLGCSVFREFARNTKFTEIKKSIAKDFINKHHIQGHVNCSRAFGLFCKNTGRLISVMTVGKSRYDKSVDYEILRFASIGSVVGGASKLFKNIKKQMDGSWITYADLRWGDGSGYLKIGFESVHRSKPSYHYFKNAKMYHRSAFMKHKIVQNLGGDPDKTEYENMVDMGYIRVWDCGTEKFISR